MNDGPASPCQPIRRPRGRGHPNAESATMFETRSELEQFLAVAEEGRIVAAAERLSMTQPALTRAVAKLERRAGGALFERLPSGVRPTALGTVAVGRARRLAREFADTDERIGGDRRRARRPAAGERRPAVDARRRRPGRASLSEGVPRRRAHAAKRRLHRRRAPARRRRGRPALGRHRRRAGAARIPAPRAAAADHRRHRRPPRPPAPRRPAHPRRPPAPPLARVLRLRALRRRRARTLARLDSRAAARAHRRASRTGAPRGRRGLLLLAEGPWLSWLPFAFLARLPALGLEPLPLTFGRRRCRTGLIARRSAEDLAPVRLFEDIVRTIALEPPG